MSDPDLALSAYLRLATISHERSQWLPRNKFLVLVGAAACEAGWLGVAEQCRELVGIHSPNHLLTRYESFPIALRSAEFQVYLKQLRKFCSIERAEFLLSNQGVALEPLTADCAAQCLQQMQPSAD